MKRKLPRTNPLCFWGLSTSLFVATVSGNNNATTVDDDGMEDNYVDEEYGSWRIYVSYSLASVCITAFLVSTIFMGVVSTTTRFTYNLYIIGLLLPDTLMNLVMGIRCIYDGFYNTSAAAPILLCRLQYVGFGFYVSNLYLNAILGHELYNLLWNSHQRRRISPPPKTKVLWQVAVTYFLVGLFSAWIVLPIDWSLLTVENVPYCVAPLGSELITTQAAMVIYVAVILPPVIYCLWTLHKVLQGKLMPKKGRSRALAMYFVRILGLFLFFYTPMCFIIDRYNNVENRDSAQFFWLLSSFTLLNCLQTLGSVIIFSQKHDIQVASRKLFCWWKSDVEPTSSSQWGMDDTYSQTSNIASGIEISGVEGTTTTTARNNNTTTELSNISVVDTSIQP